MTFEELAEFKKDLKKLLKKYRTLNDDLFEVKVILKKKPEVSGYIGSNCARVIGLLVPVISV